MGIIGLGAKDVSPVLPLGVDPAMDGAGFYNSTPFGSGGNSPDRSPKIGTAPRNLKTHDNAPGFPMRGGLPGEQEDPRLC